jgi:hypothetical protein
MLYILVNEWKAPDRSSPVHGRADTFKWMMVLEGCGLDAFSRNSKSAATGRTQHLSGSEKDRFASI